MAGIIHLHIQKVQLHPCSRTCDQLDAPACVTNHAGQDAPNGCSSREESLSQMNNHSRQCMTCMHSEIL